MMRADRVGRRGRAGIGAAGLGVALAAGPAAGAPGGGVGEADGPDASRWVRVTQNDDRVVSLEVASLDYTYHPADGGEPVRVTLVGAVHIGDERYYRNMQRLLDRYEVVLYEGVNPAGAGRADADDAELSDAERAERTEHRLRLLAILLERHVMDEGAYPGSLDELGAWLSDHPRQAEWVETARVDAWGTPVLYRPERAAEPGSYVLLSLGADGEPGGAGAAADLDFADQRALTEGELGATPGLQAKLAETFRLAFQLDEMDTTAPNWINSDMSIDELEDRFEAAGGDAGMVFGMLDGSSAMATVASAVLGMIEAIPGAAARGKLMVMEMLAVADETVMARGMAGGEAFVRVIIDERNQVVVDDLREVLESPDRPGTVALFYGAGHNADFHERFIDQLDLEPAAEMDWHPAMKLPLDRVGISRMEHAVLRASIARQIDAMRSGGMR